MKGYSYKFIAQNIDKWAETGYGLILDLMGHWKQSNSLIGQVSITETSLYFLKNLTFHRIYMGQPDFLYE